MAGDRLPPARELAEALGVNMHTVLRAYGDLRDEGLVDMRRRRGVIVRDAGDTGPGCSSWPESWQAEATKQGLSKAELRKLLEEVGGWSSSWTSGSAGWCSSSCRS